MASEPSPFSRIGNCGFCTGVSLSVLEAGGQTALLDHCCGTAWGLRQDRQGKFITGFSAPVKVFLFGESCKHLKVWSPTLLFGDAQDSDADALSSRVARCQSHASSLPCCPATPSLPGPPLLCGSPLPRHSWGLQWSRGCWGSGGRRAGAGKNSPRCPLPRERFLTG